MHETRNFIMVLLAIGSFLWGVVAWFVLDSETAPVIWFQRATSALLFVSMAVWLVYAFQIEDKLPDHMAGVVGPMCYGADGLDFMPTVRRQGEQAELCLYYQNRYENPAEVIVHLRPPEDSFIIKPGVRDVHFAFKAGGGDFGMITQPIAVPEHLQGEVIEVQLGAMSFYRRSQGARLRKRGGFACGTMLVDWGGSAFKSGVHEVSGEIELHDPTTIHLSMPAGVAAYATGNEAWRQQCIEMGPRA
jgi:hypothetical protein